MPTTEMTAACCPCLSTGLFDLHRISAFSQFIIVIISSLLVFDIPSLCLHPSLSPDAHLANYLVEQAVCMAT